MRKFLSFSLNGYATSISMFVKNKTAHTLSSSNHWSSTEYNRNNSWNVNFNNGNTNNNNKNNSNVGRAVSALGEEEIISWIEASDDCCRNKKTSLQCTLYRIRHEEILLLLALAVKERTYIPLTSDCFVVKHPTLREIFAAHFLDRIVQHWIILRLEPPLERLFVSTGDVSFNCRKGYGTLRAVKMLEGQMQYVTDNWRKDAWIGRFDMMSFFMSIRKEILWDMLNQFIKENYNEEDKGTLLWLSEITVKHRPQDNCVRKGDITLWNQLPKHKSLFYMDGTAIGNITSQILANFLLSSFDKWAYSFCTLRGGWYERFVDDIPVILPTKDDVLLFHKEASIFIESNIRQRLHPNKVYIQHASKGLKFVGTVIKPGRTYISNRTVGKMWDMLNIMEGICKQVNRDKKNIELLTKLEHYVCSCNSYMGFLRHNNSYNLKRKLFGRLSYFWKVAYIKGRYNQVSLRKRYKLTNVLNVNHFN